MKIYYLIAIIFINNLILAGNPVDSAFSKIPNNFDQNLSSINLEFDSITAMVIDKNNKIWLGSKNGLWVLDGIEFKSYSYKDGLFDKNILYLYCSENNQIWVGTPSGPYALFDNHFYVFEPLKNIKILYISESKTHWLFTTENGLNIVKKEQGIFENLYMKIFITIFLLAFFTLLIFIGIQKFKTRIEWKTNLIRIEQLALLAQMNPHFIFNSLNSVQKYIMANDKASAHTYLQKFASMMRKVLENSRKSTITINEEINTLELYLRLESLRFDNGFDFEIVVQDEEIWQFEIPTMILHTFVENAIWHGLMKKEGRGKIDIRFSMLKKKYILCEIEDNGIGRKKAADIKSKNTIKHKSKGTAIVQKRIDLLNLKSRQKILYKTIDINENQKTGTLVLLEIPVTLS